MKKNIFVITLSIFFIICSFTPALASEGNTPSGVPLSKIEEKIDEHVKKHIGKSTPGAAIGVVKDGKVIFSKGYGYSDANKKIPVNPKTTIFEYGSTGKLFVWTSVMKLVEEGKLDLNKDIKTYLPPEFSSKLKYKKPITMLNLMNHTAGFEEYGLGLTYTSSKNQLSLKDALLKHQPKQAYEPGTISSYSNYGAALAGYIVGEITGQEFSEYEKVNIFDTLNMKDVIPNPTINNNDKLKDIKAKGYMESPTGGLIEGSWFYVNLYPAGSVNGTLEDLEKFALALTPSANENTPLFKKRETLDKFLTKSYSEHKDLTSMYHGFLEFNGETTSVTHGGNTGGFSSQFLISPKERFGVIVLTNAAAEDPITNGVLDILVGKKNDDVKVNNTSLPDTRELDGHYISTRTDNKSYMAFNYYMLSRFKVESIGENKIKIASPQYNLSYVQVEPYVYKLIETPETKYVFKGFSDKIHFNVKDGEVKSLSFGTVDGNVPVSKWRTSFWLTVSAAILIIGTSYFFVSPICLLVQRLINKKKQRTFSIGNTKYKRIFTALSLSGTAVLVNNAVMVTLLTLDPAKSGIPYMSINWVLSLVAIALLVLLIRNWSDGELSKKQRIFSIITIVVLILYIWMFINWNFFNIFI